MAQRPDQLRPQMRTRDNARAGTSLEELARRVRATSLAMSHRAGVGHPGSDLSAADILVALYGAVLQNGAERIDDPDRDRFVLSKGHAACALYATLAEWGYFGRDELDTFAAPGSRLPGHPTRSIPGVEANTGALGHGLSFGVGAALAARLDGSARRTFVLTGDGELQEGANWEAAMAAAHFGLDRLTVIVDRNLLQQGAATEETMQLEPLAAKWTAFGWTVKEVDGHNIPELVATLRAVPFADGSPNCVIARTHKGRGVSFMEDRVAWHNQVPGTEDLARALNELSDGH
jgi:transketolase